MGEGDREKGLEREAAADAGAKHAVGCHQSEHTLVEQVVVPKASRDGETSL